MRRSLALAPVALLLLAAPASADEGVVLRVSEAGVFDPAVRWVPGDVRTESFTVRNVGPSAALVSLQAFRDGADALDADVRITAQRSDGTWTALGKDAVRLGTTPLGVGESRPIQVRAIYERASSNRSQGQSLDLSFRVTLAGDRSTTLDDPGVLPDTGTTISRSLVLLASLLVGVGAALIAGTRATRKSGHDQAR